MVLKTYKDLKFWITAKEVSLLVIQLSNKLPNNSRVVWIIVDQLLRASFSVGANIAEGFGKYKGKEYRRFLLIALGSANETEYWLELLRDSYPEFSETIDTILQKNVESIKMLASAVKSLDKRGTGL